ncbi:NADPH dehydrogenase NamA [Chryseobacterium sp. MFBS3-17]|uniref:NADPH dehydrogenase NamA n=1 Tax=Chryseobacterium sp. MFBS3-17 TaxID=2886689 RepID=UPI001D0E96D3|nr:NADPH dehydrogenase NamA [Chryseobacterium sp. MFBS3-17]MCC2590172.1 NADPH dehydrogenase NamA [Chryseobacterium sp. MFBS3-17]
MLYTPVQFRNLEIVNRWVMSPMCMYSAESGVPTDFHYVHYGSRAQGGTGLLMVEATGVVPAGRITHGCTGLWNEEQTSSFRKIVDFIHTRSESKIGIQLAHAGRKASTWNGKQLPLNEGWETVAASAIPYMEGERIPHELSLTEIAALVQSFQDAAVRALEAGFDVIEIHAAHGYLLHQFLSPLSNIRTDDYGGSFENRCRFLLEVVDAVNEVLDDDHPLFVRISATEYAENGWDLEESVRLANLLKERKVDLVDVSSGGNIHGARISVFDGYQVPFAARIRKEAGIATGAVGLITDAKQAEEILQAGDADLIFVAREILRNPYLAIQGAFQMDAECPFPEQYSRARK